jgi:hypothetical protein
MFFFGIELYSSFRFISSGVYGYYKLELEGLPSIKSFQKAVILGLWFSSKSYSNSLSNTASFLYVFTNKSLQASLTNFCFSGVFDLSRREVEVKDLLARIFFSLKRCFFSEVYYIYYYLPGLGGGLLFAELINLVT